jgi:hypothetical protein
MSDLGLQIKTHRGVLLEILAGVSQPQTGKTTTSTMVNRRPKSERHEKEMEKGNRHYSAKRKFM